MVRVTQFIISYQVEEYTKSYFVSEIYVSASSNKILWMYIILTEISLEYLIYQHLLK